MKKYILSLLVLVCIALCKNVAKAQFTNCVECEYFTDVDDCDTIPTLTVAIRVYPNPVEDVLYCDAVDEEVDVIDLCGHIVKRFKNRIEIYDLPQGIYFVRVRNQVFKIIKI